MTQAVRGRRLAFEQAHRALAQAPRWALVPDDLTVPSGCARLAAEPSEWPELTGPGVWLVPPDSTRVARQQVVEALFAKLPAGGQIGCTATDRSEAVLRDLLLRHFEPEVDAAGPVVVGTRRAEPLKKVLLIHPPIVSPVPLELVMVQPTALLRLASYLQSQGAHVLFYDMAPRFDLDDARRLSFPETAREYVAEHGLRPRGTLRCGNFENEQRSTSSYLFGIEPEALGAQLADWHFLDEIYISSMFTYHYQGTHELMEWVRQQRPEIRIHLGGIYPSLCPDHARASAAHHVHVGPLPEIDFERLDFSLYDDPPDFAVVKLTRGCPHRCSFCAVHLLEGTRIITRDASDAVDEVAHLCSEHGVRTFVLWESNLLGRRGYFEDFLRRIEEAELEIEFKLPEGLIPGRITDQLADRMVRTGLSDYVTLPLETADDQVLADRFGKSNSIEQLLQATGRLKERSVSVLWGMLLGFAEQTLSAAIHSILFTWQHEVLCKLMLFTPIPGTAEFDRARALIADRDLAELAPSCYPLASAELTAAEMEEMVMLFDATRYEYSQILRGEGCVRGDDGRLVRGYGLTAGKTRAPDVAQGELSEGTAYSELRKEYFLLQSAELPNPKTLLYYDVPKRARFEGFSSVLIGRELSSTEFDFPGAARLAAKVRRAQLQLGVMLPAAAGDLSLTWKRFVTSLAGEGPLSVMVSDPDALSWLAELRQRIAQLELLPGRLLPFRLLDRAVGPLQWDPSCLAVLRESFAEQWVADELALALGASEAIPVAVHVPTSLTHLSKVGDGGGTTVVRHHDARSDQTEFYRDGGRHRISDELTYFAAHPSVAMLYQYTIPR